MGWQISEGQDTIRFALPNANKGIWTHASIASAPDGYVIDLDNFDLPGGVITSMDGDAAFISTVWPVGWGATLNGAFEYKVAGSDPTIIICTTSGYVGRWTGSAWAIMRNDRTAVSTDWWSGVQIGTDFCITNRTDGVYRWDGTTLIPIGAKSIATMETGENSQWSGSTADTTNFREGSQARYVESTGPQTTMTFTPTGNFNGVTGRNSAVAYETDKSPGTDFYHFWVKFTNTGTLNTTTTRLLITDTDGDSLNFPMTVWRTSKSATGTVLTATPVDGTWYEIWMVASDGTETLTFDASKISTFAFAVATSAGTRRMIIDDFYQIYANTMPAVQVLEEWKSMLFGADGTSRNAYYFSEVDAPDQYNTLATAKIGAVDENITGLKKFYNQLTVLTQNHVHSLSGSILNYTYPAYLFDTNEVTDEIGCSSHRSIVKAKNTLYWWWQRQLCKYNGQTVEKMSYPIDVTLATVADASLVYISGAQFFGKNQLWWTWRRSGQTANDRVMRYDIEAGAFLPTTTLTTPLILRTTSSGAEALLTFNEAARTVYQEGVSGQLGFAGTNIAGTFTLPPINLTGDALEGVVVWLNYLTNTGNITVAYRIADHLRALSGASYTTLETVDQAVAGELGRIRIDDRAAWFQLRITTSGVKTQIQPPIVVEGVRLGRPF